jgi:glycosyltransferase involved in cell wall biosynthesis
MRAAMARLNRLNVLLLRDVPEERRLSMERFADGLEQSLPYIPRVSVRATALHESRIAAKVGLRHLDSYACRFVRYPVAARLHRADIYHIIDQGYGHLAALLPRRRTVITCHDLMLLRAAEGDAGFTPRFRSVTRFRWSTSFLRSVAHVVCVSESTRDDVIRLAGVQPVRTTVIPPGVEARFRPLGKVERSVVAAEIAGSADHVVLHVSTGHPYKNVPGTLRVVSEAKKTGLRIVLARVGAPLREDDWNLARKLGVAGDVIELGRVSDERLIELYNAADVLLFPSHLEGFGLPVLEAMACGTPVVSSSAPSLVSIAGDAALVAPATDVESLAGAVVSILSSPSLAENLRSRGFRRAAQFTWQRAASDYVSVYDRVLKESGHNRSATAN